MHLNKISKLKNYNKCMNLTLNRKLNCLFFVGYFLNSDCTFLKCLFILLFLVGVGLKGTKPNFFSLFSLNIL